MVWGLVALNRWFFLDSLAPVFGRALKLVMPGQDDMLYVIC